jgi:hypothetical protein
MLQSVAQIRDAIDPLASAAKDTPESIGHRVSIEGPPPRISFYTTIGGFHEALSFISL